MVAQSGGEDNYVVLACRALLEGIYLKDKKKEIISRSAISQVTPYLVLARRVADIVNVGDPRLPVQVAKGAVCHGELVVGQGQSVNLFLQWFSP